MVRFLDAWSRFREGYADYKETHREIYVQNATRKFDFRAVRNTVQKLRDLERRREEFVIRWWVGVSVSDDEKTALSSSSRRRWG